MDDKVEAVRLRDQPKKTRTQITEKDCRIQKINKKNATDHSKWRKLIQILYNTNKDRD